MGCLRGGGLGSLEVCMVRDREDITPATLNSGAAELARKVMAALFASGGSAPAAVLARTAGIDERELLSVADHMENSGAHPFALSFAEDTVFLRLKITDKIAITQHATVKTMKLSDQALETLAIIAYKQPVERKEVEALRMTDCEKAIHTLIEAGLVRQLGNMKVPGAPVLYAVTEGAVARLGFNSYTELRAAIAKNLQSLEDNFE